MDGFLGLSRIYDNGKIFICRRKADKSLGGFWEFPGGKVEEEESYEGCLKRELKEKEGSPEVKQRIRSIQREMAQKRMMNDVPKADVIVTNPTVGDLWLEPVLESLKSAGFSPNVASVPDGENMI